MQPGVHEIPLGEVDRRYATKCDTDPTAPTHYARELCGELQPMGHAMREGVCL